MIFPESDSKLWLTMEKIDIEADRLRVQLEMDRLALRGEFFDKDKVPYMERAAAKVAGIHISVLGDELLDGTKSKDPSQTGIRITTYPERPNLDLFWGEVRRLEAESKKPKGLLSRLKRDR